MTDNTQELDEILEDFYDGDIRQSDMGKAKQAILQWVADEVVGKDEYSGEYSFDETPYDTPRNELRDELRQKLKAEGWKSD